MGASGNTVPGAATWGQAREYRVRPRCRPVVGQESLEGRLPAVGLVEVDVVACVCDLLEHRCGLQGEHLLDLLEARCPGSRDPLARMAEEAVEQQYGRSGAAVVARPQPRSFALDCVPSHVYGGGRYE
jgi:hypothetical protein